MFSKLWEGKAMDLEGVYFKCYEMMTMIELTLGFADPRKLFRSWNPSLLLVPLS